MLTEAGVLSVMGFCASHGLSRSYLGIGPLNCFAKVFG